jgi:undecaprenyl-diphosphatase
VTPLRAIVLALVQGVTEFVPVSSSGHLILARWALGWTLGSPAVEKAFDVAVHTGTLAGAAAYLRADLVGLARTAMTSVRRRKVLAEERLPWLVVLSVIPAALTGALFEDVITDRLGAPWLVAVALVLLGATLWVADRRVSARPIDGLGWWDAALVGMAQAAALQPGVSRSGATMAAARALGFERDGAARLSFLMSIPLIAGAAGYEAVSLARVGVDRTTLAPMAFGAVAAAVTSLGAIWLVLGVVRTRSFRPFVVYRVLLGVAVLVAVAAR